MSPEWRTDLIRLIQECRAMNHDQSFAQVLYTVVKSFDRTHHRDMADYEADFYDRLLSIDDVSLVMMIKDFGREDA